MHEHYYYHHHYYNPTAGLVFTYHPMTTQVVTKPEGSEYFYV